MYATLMQITIDPALASAAAAAFTNDILPRVRSARGFVAGYWVDPIDGRGFGFMLFEEEDQARAITPPAMPWSAPGVVITDVAVHRVAVAIPS